MKNLFLLALLATLTGACTWVEVEEDAESVVVGTKSHIRGCEKLSETSVKVADKVGPINRSEETIAEELVNLGKNEAVRMGADTIVPLGEPTDGRQTFAMYRCQ